MARIRIGTSGYVYQHWRGILYPKGLPADEWLAWVKQQLAARTAAAPILGASSQ